MTFKVHFSFDLDHVKFYNILEVFVLLKTLEPAKVP